jgi:hypothetical protein
MENNVSALRNFFSSSFRSAAQQATGSAQERQHQNVRSSSVSKEGAESTALQETRRRMQDSEDAAQQTLKVCENDNVCLIF